MKSGRGEREREGEREGEEGKRDGEKRHPEDLQSKAEHHLGVKALRKYKYRSKVQGLLTRGGNPREI